MGINSVRPLKQIPPQNITEPPPNGTLGEILQNIATVCRQTRSRPSGDHLKIKPSSNR
jgi:hypothetical protein